MNTEKQKIEYKAIMVRTETHELFKKVSQENGRNFDRFLIYLLTLYANPKKLPK